MALLELEHLDIAYNGQPALRDVSLTVEPCEIFGIAGESGCGKSTLIRGVMGLLPPEGTVTGGVIRYRGEDLRACPPRRLRQLRGREMGMVFQNCAASLCPVRTVWSQLREALGREVSPQEARKRALELMAHMHLEDGERILQSYPFELSGGMNQRVGLMLAMALRPSLLFADEPTSALDVTVQREVLREMQTLQQLHGTAIVLVTHNLAVLEALADRVAILKDGTLVEIGTAAEVFGAPRAEYTRQLLAAVPRLRR